MPAGTTNGPRAHARGPPSACRPDPPRRPDKSQRAMREGPLGNNRHMKALVKAAPGPGLQLRDVPDPEYGINDVLIRVHKTGICGTDLHIDSWDPWAQKTIHPPLIVGHEFVGEIVAVGSNVTDFTPGDLV